MLIKNFNEYCEKHINEDNLIKSMYIDTKIYEHERDDNILEKIDRLAPFGE
jgi:hypothetical protein